MLESATIPSDTLIRDVSVVHHAGSTLVVCVDAGDGLWTWSPSSGEWVARPLPYAHAAEPDMADYPEAENDLDDVAALSVDGRLLVAAGGDEQSVAAWDLGTGELQWRRPFYSAYLLAVTAVDGAFVTAEFYGDELHLWSPDGTPTPLGEVRGLFCLGAAQVGGRHLVLAGGEEVLVWDTTSRTGTSFQPGGGRVWAVTACALEGRTAVLAVTGEGRLCTWDLDGDPAEPLYEPVATGHESVRTTAVMTLRGRPVVVTRGEDSLRLWDVATGTGAGRLDTPGHGVTVIESTTVDGRRALVTAGRDGVLRVWDESDVAG